MTNGDISIINISSVDLNKIILGAKKDGFIQDTKQCYIQIENIVRFEELNE